jgi:hypothetical protein
MPALAALATSVGVLAVLATWLFGLGPLTEYKLQVWIAFIAWGCHFHSGGGVKGSTTALVSMSFGAVIGMAAAIVGTGMLAGLADWAIPVAVGIGAAIICVASKVKLLETIPAGVYGFASIFGLLAVTGLGATEALIPTVLSVLVGTIFGYVSEMVANALTKKGEPDAEATADPGHAG